MSKVEGAAQELDETAYWLELLADADIVPLARVTPLRAEAHELTAILVTSVLAAMGKRPVRGRGDDSAD